MNIEEACDLLGYNIHMKNALVKAYEEPHRAYHNRTHVENILNLIPYAYGFVFNVNVGGYDFEKLIEATLWHDYVYPDRPMPPGRAEMESMLTYIEWMQDFKSAYDDRVCEMITATAFHGIDQPQIIHDPLTTQLFLDLDISSFASSHAEEDSENVAKELGAVYGEEKFLIGNRAFMRGLLKRKQLYYLMTEWEAPARAYLEKRIEAVSYTLQKFHGIGDS